ncbi:MAG TPA: PIN domain-containing protein [Candidatus Limnocylindria bacterium]
MPSSSAPEPPGAGAELVRVFVDADALFAGSASSTGASHMVLQLSELGIIRAFTSRQAQEEVERNLTAKLPAALPAFRAIVAAACHPATEPTIAAVRRLIRADACDPKDGPILAAAMATGCPWLLTFNVRDFRAGDRIRVAEPGEFLTALRERLTSLAEP